MINLGDKVITSLGEGSVVDINPNEWDGVAVQIPNFGTMYYNLEALELVE
jgi:hypothetical protein